MAWVGLPGQDQVRRKRTWVTDSHRGVLTGGAGVVGRQWCDRQKPHRMGSCQMQSRLRSHVVSSGSHSDLDSATSSNGGEGDRRPSRSPRLEPLEIDASCPFEPERADRQGFMTLTPEWACLYPASPRAPDELATTSEGAGLERTEERKGPQRPEGASCQEGSRVGGRRRRSGVTRGWG